LQFIRPQIAYFCKIIFANKHINTKALLLLLIYTFGNIPFGAFHDHVPKRINHQHASTCEQEVFYGNASQICEHTDHVSTAVEKCLLCDYHHLMDHQLIEFNFVFFHVQEINSFHQHVQSFLHCASEQFANKGPPQLLHLIA
jgi:hypothetical protein